ncbi:MULTISPECIES: sensor histidine kinase [Ralstonia]|uniref:histidine kinase n=1 Tax=Ralstonia holmesii TaxID=3058602 RepID=A0ABC8QNG1_9RALS|nr:MULTISPECIES: HAMP domain-containing sensor histidine kinase [unclassified Ralstonia]CAJ0806232.1 Adaptive-response sensory-kinase SasA [Ralstonia sp. LMG 32967]CAJ0811235.1 Adaptive-response sensory-kinase SasA [Ralstonia sp. LMG 32967]
MDGLQRQLNESVQLKLSFALALAILVVALIAGGFSFWSALDEAHELQDDMLRQVAALMDHQRLSPDFLSNEKIAAGVDEESRVIVQRLGDGNQASIAVDEGGALPLATSLPEGLQTLNAGGEMFRVLVKTTSRSERIAVAQEIGFRNEIARGSAFRTVTPFLVLVPLLLLVVANLVRQMFRPIAGLSSEIDRRGERDLHPVDEEHLPTEVRPFVVAINRMLARVSQSMEAQRRFVADAAHELRSPLTALSLQAERLAEAEMSAIACERLRTLRQGIERSRNLLGQLLSMAKAQSSVEPLNTPVSVQSIYRRVLEDLMPLAEAKQIDIGVESVQDAQVWASEVDMIAMVRNLVDNAIRFTPPGGQVNLSVNLEDRRVALCVEDTGPGIPLSERELVFSPFYRTLGSNQIGSGLGLAIVKAVTDRIGAEVQLSFSDQVNQSGLKILVFIPTKDFNRTTSDAASIR